MRLHELDERDHLSSCLACVSNIIELVLIEFFFEFVDCIVLVPSLPLFTFT